MALADEHSHTRFGLPARLRAARHEQARAAPTAPLSVKSAPVRAQQVGKPTSFLGSFARAQMPPSYQQAHQHQAQVPAPSRPQLLAQQLATAKRLGSGSQGAVFELPGLRTVAKLSYPTPADKTRVPLQLGIAGILHHRSAVLPTSACLTALDGPLAGLALPGTPELHDDVSGAPVALVMCMPRVWGQSLKEVAQECACVEAAALTALAHCNVSGGAAQRMLDVARARRACVATDMLVQMASLMTEMEQLGLMHRDIKLDNIMLDEEGVMKLIDWGFATKFDRSGARPTRARLYGTLLYMAPELLGGASCALAMSQDAFSLGVVAWLLLCGHRCQPFLDQAGIDACMEHWPNRASVAAAMLPLLRAAPGLRWPAGLRESLPPALVEVVEGLLQRDPAQRMTLAEVQVKLGGLTAAPAAASPPPATVVAAAPCDAAAPGGRGLFGEEEVKEETCCAMAAGAPMTSGVQAARTVQRTPSPAGPAAPPAPAPSARTPGYMASTAASRARAMHRPPAVRAPPAAPSRKAAQAAPAPPPPPPRACASPAAAAPPPQPAPAPVPPLSSRASPSPAPPPCQPEACSDSPSVSPPSSSSAVLYPGASASVLSSASSTSPTATTNAAPPHVFTHSSCGGSYGASSTSSGSPFSQECSSPPAPSTPDRVSDHGLPAPSTPGRNPRASFFSLCLAKADGRGTCAPCRMAPLYPTASCYDAAAAGAVV